MFTTGQTVEFVTTAPSPALRTARFHSLDANPDFALVLVDVTQVLGREPQLHSAPRRFVVPVAELSAKAV